jgi:hypothetical protein
MPQDISYDTFRQEWLSEVTAGNPSTVELGHRFAYKLVTQWLEIEGASEDLVYCDGSGDGGIDVAYLDRGDEEDDGDATSIGHTWYLVQSKYGSAFAGEDTLVREGRKVIDTLDGQRQKLSSLTEDLIGRLTNFRRQVSPHDRLTLVFATIDPLTNAEKRALDDIRTVGRSRIGTLFDVEAVSLQTIYQRVLEGGETLEQPRLKVDIKAKVVESGGGLLVGSVSLTDLFAFLKTYRSQTGNLDQLYEKNVRQFLGSRRKVNKNMRDTLEKTPERFGLYNNGITFVVANYTIDGDDHITLVEPFVVNGCQTTRTIWEVCNQTLESGGTGVDPTITEWRNRAAQGVVVTKIVKVGFAGEPMLRDITQYTNSQNAVRDKDFIALDTGFQGWARAMADNYNVFLEIQRGGWDSRRALQKQSPEIKQFAESANAFDLLKVYASGWLQEAGRAFGRNAAFVPGGNVYKWIMESDDSEAFGVEDLYAAYLLDVAARTYQFGRGAPKTSRRQTRFFFFLVVLELLKHAMLRAEMETSHRSMTKAMLCLFAPQNTEALKGLLDTAIEVVDEYLTQGADDSLFDEPSFRTQFNGNLNGFLKWEHIGKSEEQCPNFRNLLAATKKVMGKSMGGQPSVRELVINAIQTE